MSKVCDVVTELVRPFAEQLGLELVEVTYAKKSDGMNLTIVIDKEDGINITDCENLHRAIDLPLDDANPTNDAAYILNVTSPGLDRPITTERDFARNTGKEIEIRLYAPLKGRKSYCGILTSHDESTVSIEVNGQIIVFNNQMIAKILPVIKF